MRRGTTLYIAIVHRSRDVGQVNESRKPSIIQSQAFIIPTELPKGRMNLDFMSQHPSQSTYDPVLP